VFAFPDFCHSPYLKVLDNSFRDTFELRNILDGEEGLESLCGLLISLPGRISEFSNRDAPFYLCLEGVA
jgi:hypothetical protein